MMQYPLTIEQFQYSEFERGIGKEFITAFINAINNVYEKGRRVKNSGFCFTVGMVKGWYEKEYHSMCESEESNMLFDIYTEYANEAWRQGVRASGEVVDIPTDEVKIYPCFAAHEPEPEKMQRKERYFEETGLLHKLFGGQGARHPVCSGPVRQTADCEGIPQTRRQAVFLGTAGAPH